MTLFAGIYSIYKKRPLDYGVAELMEKQLGRSNGKLDVFRSPYFFLAKFDLGAFNELGYLEDGEEVSAIAGEPFLDLGEEKVNSRFSDLEKLSKELGKGNTKILDFCNGTFSICHYNQAKHCFILATDKLGSRPVYYYFDNEMLYFSSSIRVMELVPDIPKRLNISAFIEKKVYGVVLGDQTEYSDIRVLRDGQCIKCNGERPQIAYYFRWDKLPSIEKEEHLLMEECYEAFKKAVTCRSQRANGFFALLSGGLDSRCTVSILNDLGKEVIALNFAHTGPQDVLFSRQYADRIGIKFITTAQAIGNVGPVKEVIRTMDPKIRESVQYPKLVFSGDGGSVGVGHVYISRGLIDLLKRGKTEDAIRFFLKDRNFPSKLIKKNILNRLLPIRFNSLKRELDDLHSPDPVRAFHLFLMRNDQHRHVHGYYENIDLIGIEFLLPFYDARLLKIILSEPAEPFLYHEFYHKWLNLFPKDTTSVPWQTYHGHAPCPIKPEVNLPDQWEVAKKRNFIDSKSLLNKCFHMLNEPDFPKEIIDRRILLIAILLHKMRLEDYSYIFNFTVNLYDYYSKCDSVNFKSIETEQI
jgi:asparagine synthase (glutamine-hydrolysing)